MNEITLQTIRTIGQQPQNRDYAVVIEKMDKLSLQDVIQEGSVIPRSNHLGNDYPSNQAFVNSVPGAHFNLYDRTTGVDRNYFPWQVIVGRHPTDIAKESPNDLLTPFFEPNRNFFNFLESCPPELQVARTPAQLHYLSQKLLHPSTVLFSEWIKNYEEDIAVIMDVISRGYPVFDRETDHAGRVFRVSKAGDGKAGKQVIKTAEVIRNAVVDGNVNQREGLLIHKNELNLYLDTVVGALDPANQRVIDGELWGYVLHGAGPDMIRYALGSWRELGRFHEIVSTQLSTLPLPKKIFLGLVPTAELKLALPVEESGNLDSLVELVSRRDELRKTIISKPSPSAEEIGIRRAIKDLVSSSKIRDIDFSAKFSPHLSHYDVISGTGHIVFPRGLYRVPFEQLKRINESLNQRSERGNKSK